MPENGILTRFLIYPYHLLFRFPSNYSEHLSFVVFPVCHALSIPTISPAISPAILARDLCTYSFCHVGNDRFYAWRFLR